MAKRKRPVASTDDWVQLQLLCDWPDQATYQLIRPVILFGLAPAKRAQQVGVSVRTVQRKVALFDRVGLPGLHPPAPPSPDIASPRRYDKQASTSKPNIPPSVPLRLFENYFRSPQLMLWEPNAVEWRLAFHRPRVTGRSRPTVAVE